MQATILKGFVKQPWIRLVAALIFFLYRVDAAVLKYISIEKKKATHLR